MPEQTASPSTRAEVNASFQSGGTPEVRGTVRIAPSVLIELIGTTVRNTPGVQDLRPHRRRKPDEEAASAGKAYDDGKILVIVDGDQISTDVTVAVARGTNIGELSQAIQRKVGDAAGRMLGMTVRAVNVYVEDIVDPAS